MPTRDPDFYDDFVAADGFLEGRVSPVGGETWDDIVGGRLVIDNNRMTRLTLEDGGAYGMVTLARKPARVRAHISWTGTDEGGIVIISATGEEPQPLEWMVHPVWLVDRVLLTIWQDFAPGDTTTFLYDDPLALDTSYEVGWDIDADTLTLLMPDGSREHYTDPLVARCSGPVTIFQSYNPDAVEQSPRFDDVSAWNYSPRGKASLSML